MVTIIIGERWWDNVWQNIMIHFVRIKKEYDAYSRGLNKLFCLKNIFALVLVLEILEIMEI